MEYVYTLLETEIKKLTMAIAKSTNLQHKAELIGQKNLVVHSLKLLQKCEENNISAGAIFTKLPPKQCDTPSCEYRIIEDGELDNPKHWYEVEIEGKPFGHVRLQEGDVVIEL